MTTFDMISFVVGNDKAWLLNQTLSFLEGFFIVYSVISIRWKMKQLEKIRRDK